MFRAAFRSRSCLAPQIGHVQALSYVRFLLTLRQLEQVLDVFAALTYTTLIPSHAALYSTCLWISLKLFKFRRKISAIVVIRAPDAPALKINEKVEAPVGESLKVL
jgi:hypothetical protein